MPNAFCHAHRVAFAEADPAGIAHFSRYPLWVEEAETSFWQSKGVATPVVADNRLTGWPKLAFSIQHRAPVRFGETVTVALIPQVSSASTLTWRFRITRDDTLLAEGEMVVIYAEGDPLGGRLQKRSIPPELLALLQEPPC